MVDILRRIIYNMTHLPRSELIGVLQPYSINFRDVGNNPWTDLGNKTVGSAVMSPAHLGNGVALVGDAIGSIWRSTDYGVNWINISPATILVATGTGTHLLSYFGNGIVIGCGPLSGPNFTVVRSTDFGQTFVTTATLSTAISQCVTYLGGGAGLLGTNTVAGVGHIWSSSNFGVTWADQGGITVGATSAGHIFVITYLEGGTVLFGDLSGNIFRSLNFGVTWSTVTIPPGPAIVISDIVYLGRGIVLASGLNLALSGQIWRSIDYGVTWTSVFSIGVTVNRLSYLGNGVAVASDTVGDIIRSLDYGLTWTNLGDITGVGSNLRPIQYLDNGVAIAGAANGHIFRSEVSYKTNESQVNYPRIPFDVTGGRVFNTTYTNSDQTRTLQIKVTGRCATPGGLPRQASFQAFADTASPPITAASGIVGLEAGLLNEDNSFQLVFDVQPGLNYRVNTTVSNGTVTLGNWFEMYI
jgi:hypothetical protein